MQAHVLILHHDAAGFQVVADIEVLGVVLGRRLQPGAQIGFFAVGGKGDAVHRADVDAGIALDAELAGEDGLDVAIEAALGFLERQFEVIAELDLGLDVAQRHHFLAMRHLIALIRRDLVVVRPFVDAHLLAGDGDLRRRADIDVLAAAEPIDRDGGLMAVRHRPDDILRPERGVAAEEHFWIGRGHGRGSDLRHIPLVERDAAIALDPGEGILLSDGDQHVVAGKVLIRLAGRYQIAAAFGVAHRLDLFEDDTGQLAVVVGEFLGHQEIEDRDILVHGVLLFPGGRLHLLEAGAHDHLDVLAAEPARGAAAIHGGIAAAEHDDALADRGDVTERDAGQPVDADMYVLDRFLAAGNVEVAAARRAAADEDGVKIIRQQRLQAVDALTADELDADIEDVIALLVDDAFRQTEFRNLRAHHAAGFRILVEHDALVAHRGQVPRHRERSWAAAHERDALAVLDLGRFGQAVFDIVLEIGGDALEPADRHRFFLDSAAPAGRLARPIAGAS